MRKAWLWNRGGQITIFVKSSAEIYLHENNWTLPAAAAAPIPPLFDMQTADNHKNDDDDKPFAWLSH